MPQHACPLSCVRNHSITACVYIAHSMRVTGVVHTCTLPHMHSHSIVARVWLVTGVRVPCMGEDSVVAARHCFSAIPDTRRHQISRTRKATLGESTTLGV